MQRARWRSNRILDRVPPVSQRRNRDVTPFCPAAEGRGAFEIVRENVTRSVYLSVCLSDRELPNANSEPIELGMVLNEGEDRKTMLRRG